MIWNGMKSFVQNRCKIHQKKGPWAFKITPGGSQNRGWGRPQEPRCTQEMPKTSQDVPKRSQERPRGNQDAPTSAQETPKRRPNTPQRGRETVNLLKNRCSEGPERIPDAFGSVRGARCGPILEKSILRSLCDRIWIGFFDDRKKRDP